MDSKNNSIKLKYLSLSGSIDHIAKSECFYNKQKLYLALLKVYNNGQVILDEMPETTGPVEVLVIFTEDTTSIDKKNNGKPIFGIGKGLLSYMFPDFDEPLEDLKDYM